MDARIPSPDSADTLHQQRKLLDKPRLSRSLRAVKKFWSTVGNSFKTAFRALGLSVIISSIKSLRHPLGKGFEERTKIAIRKGRSTALLRALIHVVPVGIAVWEVALNWNTYYVGSTALRLVYYQIAAKVHEMMIQASLATIVLSYVRHEMVLGNGIPFGALFSGLQINQLSYLWSMEFWGSVGSSHVPIRKRIVTMVFISICFLLAAVAGPSSAVLLIPRLDYWPAGSTHIWINATVNDIWPDRVNGSSVPRYCAISQDNSLSNECPSSEWQFLQTWMSMTQKSLPMIVLNQSILMDYIAPSFSGIQLTGKSSTRQYMESDLSFPVIIDGKPISATKFPISTTSTQHAAIADALNNVGGLWESTIDYANTGGHHGKRPSDERSAVHTIANDYYQPYAAISCLRDMIQGSDDQRSIVFPISDYIDYDSEPGLSININGSIDNYPGIEYPSIIRAQLLQLPGSRSDNRIKWVQLPENLFNGSALGLIVLLPADPVDPSRDNATQMVVCNIGAGWGLSSINAQSTLNGLSVTSSVFKADRSAPFADSSSPEENGANYYQANTDRSINYDPPDYPSKTIKIDEDWLNYLNPSIPTLNTSVIDFLLKETAKSVLPPAEVATQYIIGGLLVNGLARVGYTSQLQGTVKLAQDEIGQMVPDSTFWVSGKGDIFTVDPHESKDWVKLRVDSTMEGYAYNTIGPSPKIAIAFLLTYCVLALAHCFYSGISGISSTCWDSISEVTALAINSQPTTILRNTCAGITEIRIFKTSVRILAMSDEEGEGEHLELVFGNVTEENAQKKAIKPNRVYGTMPASKSASSSDEHLKAD